MNETDAEYWMRRWNEAIAERDEAVRLLETSKTVLTIALMLAKEAAKHLPASAPIDMEEAKLKLGLVMLHIDQIDAYLAKHADS